MLTDACPSGDNRDVHQVEVPEPAQFGPPCNGDVKGGAQLYGPAHAGRGRRLVGGINGVGDVFSPLDLRTEELKKLVCFTIWSAQWSSSCLVEMMLNRFRMKASRSTAMKMNTTVLK